MNGTLTGTLTGTLQQARKARRISQLELSLRMGVSQRHVSFVESGRAKPSREMLVAWLQTLEAPLALRNAALLQAGYAPVYSEKELNDTALAPANDALLALIKSHDPMPAFVMDAQWNVLHFNSGARWLMLTLMPWIAELPVDATHNLLNAMLHPEGFLKPLVNLEEVGPALLAHLRDDASSQPSIAPQVQALAELLRERLGNSNSLQHTWPRQIAPVLTSRFATKHGELAFFSMFTTFGTPQDITLASLRVEHMFAANDATREVLKREVPH
jgi:transcriptional regulator with XRE-family HTH domain